MTDGERVLTRRELNRALLARQHLLARTRGRLPRVLERIGGIQAQYAPSMCVGLWSRLADFERDALTRALERRSVVRGTLMRVTIHLVSARDYWPLAVAIAAERRRLWLRATDRKQINSREMAALARRLRARLAGGTMRRAEIQELAGDATRTNGVGLWVDLVRVPPSGTWERRRADLYALAEEWVERRDHDPAAGVEHLVRRYLRGFRARDRGRARPDRAAPVPRRAAPVPRRGRSRAGRPSAGAAARARHAGAGALLADLGRDPARPRPPEPDPPR